MLIPADTQSHGLHSSHHACTSAASGIGQVNQPNATYVDSNPTMSYMWDLSVALGQSTWPIPDAAEVLA